MALGKPKLSTKTPDSEDVNALLVEGVHDALIKAFRSPGQTSRRYIVAAIDIDEVTDRGDGAAFAKYSLRHVEFSDEETLLAAYSDRTGNPSLPGDDSTNQLDVTGLDPIAP